MPPKVLAVSAFARLTKRLAESGHAGLLVIRVVRLTTLPEGDEINVSIFPSLVGSNTTVTLNPWRACSSQRNASVFGAQIARVLGRRHLTLKLLSA